MNIFEALLEAQWALYQETGINCTDAKIHPGDARSLQEHPDFRPCVPGVTSLFGYVTNIEVKVDGTLRQGWAHLYGPGLNEWKLARLKEPEPPKPTAWDRIGGNDLV